jgi:hypothetical protein
MPEDLTVLVGAYYQNTPWTKERFALAEAISKRGFQVEIIEGCWPRDSYVFHNGHYVSREENQHYGEGGLFRLGLDYMLVSEALFEKRVISEGRARYRLNEFFPGTRIHFVPFGPHPEQLDASQHGHIDLSVLLLPQDKLLVVDKAFYVGVRDYKKKFGQVAEAEGLDLHFYDSCARNFWQEDYPLNCLVLPTNEGEVVFANQKTPHFVRLLRERGVEVITIPFVESPRHGGSINCATNVKERDKDLRNIGVVSEPYIRGLFTPMETRPTPPSARFR